MCSCVAAVEQLAATVLKIILQLNIPNIHGCRALVLGKALCRGSKCNLFPFLLYSFGGLPSRVFLIGCQIILKFIFGQNFDFETRQIIQQGRGHWTINHTGWHPKLYNHVFLSKTLGTYINCK